jgi:DNA-binding NtrC family response regulator
MGGRKRILVVDDEVNVLFIMHDALIRLGSEYEIVTAQNGHEALGKVRAMPFDLVFTDLRMPDMDGVELTEAIKTVNPNTVVIWMTAYGCHSVRAEAVQLMVYDCLDKPVEVAEIWRIAREALESTGGQDPTIKSGR